MKFLRGGDIGAKNAISHVKSWRTVLEGPASVRTLKRRKAECGMSQKEGQCAGTSWRCGEARGQGTGEPGGVFSSGLPPSLHDCPSSLKCVLPLSFSTVFGFRRQITHLPSLEDLSEGSEYFPTRGDSGGFRQENRGPHLGCFLWPQKSLLHI